MTKALGAALVVLATSLIPSAVDEVGAAPPAIVTIDTMRVGPTGTFDSTGAIDDEGTFVVEDPVFGGPGPGQFVIVHATETFEGAAGSFTLVRNIRVTWGEDPGLRTISGTWSVVAGTGSYEDLQARGTINGTVQGAPPAEVFSLTYTGTANP